MLLINRMSWTEALTNKKLEKHCIRERKRQTCRSSWQQALLMLWNTLMEFEVTDGPNATLLLLQLAYNLISKWAARKKKIINHKYNNIKAFENKLQLWELQRNSNKMACILTLRIEKPTHTKIYTHISKVLQNEFNSQFQNFRQHQATFIYFSSFAVHIKIIPREFQLSLLNYNVIKA
jgi:hypothetical protein